MKSTNTGMSVKAIQLRQRAQALRDVEAPSSLDAPPGATPRESKTHLTAQSLYREIAVAGDQGAEIGSLGFMIGSDEKRAAIEVLRASGSVTIGLERRSGSTRRRCVARIVTT